MTFSATTLAGLFGKLLVSTVFALTFSSFADIVVTATVTRVIDGDTFVMAGVNAAATLRIPSRDGFTVRIVGVDAPERDQPAGREITRALSRALVGTNLILSLAEAADGKVAYDKYGRTLAKRLCVDGSTSDLREMLLLQGMAWSTGDDKKLDVLHAMARNRGVGLWRQTNPVPPWKWRMQQQMTTLQSSVSTARPTATDASSFKFMVNGTMYSSVCHAGSIGNVLYVPDDLLKRGIRDIFQIRISIDDSFRRLSANCMEFTRNRLTVRIHYGKYNNNQESMVKLDKKQRFRDSKLYVGIDEFGNKRLYYVGSKSPRKYSNEHVCFYALYRSASDRIVEVDYLGEEKGVDSNDVIYFR